MVHCTVTWLQGKMAWHRAGQRSHCSPDAQTGSRDWREELGGRGTLWDHTPRDPPLLTRLHLLIASQLHVPIIQSPSKSPTYECMKLLGDICTSSASLCLAIAENAGCEDVYPERRGNSVVRTVLPSPLNLSQVLNTCLMKANLLQHMSTQN